MMMIAGVVIGLVSLAYGILELVDRNGGEAWFYWIAPLLAIGFAGVVFNLVVQYYMKVGRLEMKGRPRK